MAPQLSVSQRSRLRTMIGNRVHPDQIDGYLKDCGVSDSALDDVYSDLNLRRSHLLDCYKMKRNVRIIGVLVMLASITVPIVSAGEITILVSIGLLVYGFALTITGSLTVYQP